MTRRRATSRNPAKAKRGAAPKAAPNRRLSASSKDTEVARLTRERDDTVEQLSATSEVRGSSPPREPVFTTILGNAVRICREVRIDIRRATVSTPMLFADTRRNWSRSRRTSFWPVATHYDGPATSDRLHSDVLKVVSCPIGACLVASLQRQTATSPASHRDRIRHLQKVARSWLNRSSSIRSRAVVLGNEPLEDVVIFRRNPGVHHFERGGKHGRSKRIAGAADRDLRGAARH